MPDPTNRLFVFRPSQKKVEFVVVGRAIDLDAGLNDISQRIINFRGAVFHVKALDGSDLHGQSHPGRGFHSQCIAVEIALNQESTSELMPGSICDSPGTNGLGQVEVTYGYSRPHMIICFFAVGRGGIGILFCSLMASVMICSESLPWTTPASGVMMILMVSVKPVCSAILFKLELAVQRIHVVYGKVIEHLRRQVQVGAVYQLINMEIKGNCSCRYFPPGMLPR